MRNRAASIKDVAARAGVSIGTVSNVLNRPELVGDATQARVLSAIAELGFVRNESGRQLRAGRSRTIAYVMLDARNPFFSDVAQGVEEAARRDGVSVFLCNSANDPAREAEYLDLLVEQRVRGVLLTPVGADSPGLTRLRERGVPAVLVDRAGGGSWSSVGVDDVEGGRLAVDHLCRQGHRRIAFVGGPLGTVQVADRRRGAEQAMEAAGRKPDELIVVTTDGLDVAAGRWAGEHIARLPRSRRPTAAFCANDLVALGLLQQMTATGIDVPSELAIVGYDDIDFAAAAAVPLSSIRQPRHELGRMAAELLLEQSDERAAGALHRHVVFQPELVVRASSTTAVKRSRRPAPTAADPAPASPASARARS